MARSPIDRVVLAPDPDLYGVRWIPLQTIGEAGRIAAHDSRPRPLREALEVTKRLIFAKHQKEWRQQDSSSGSTDPRGRGGGRSGGPPVRGRSGGRGPPGRGRSGDAGSDWRGDSWSSGGWRDASWQQWQQPHGAGRREHRPPPPPPAAPMSPPAEPEVAAGPPPVLTPAAGTGQPPAPAARDPTGPPPASALYGAHPSVDRRGVSYPSGVSDHRTGWQLIPWRSGLGA